jgi:uncharacterized membrane protein
LLIAFGLSLPIAAMSSHNLKSRGQTIPECCQINCHIYACATHFFTYYILEDIVMITFILLAIFVMIARDEHRAATRKRAKELSDSQNGIITVTTIVIDDGDPW